MLARYYNWWAAAFFRTVNLFGLGFSSKSIPGVKLLSTCGANAFKFGRVSGDSLTYNPTSDLINSTWHNGKCLSTNRADFFNSLEFSGSPITFGRTVFPVSDTVMEHKGFSTNETRFFNSGISGVVKTFAGTVFHSLCMGVKLNAAKFTGFYNGYQSFTRFDKLVHILLGNTTTYNLSVKDDPVYFANGYLVHNCDICSPRDGVVYPIDDHPYAPSHPRCRCTFVPKIALPEGYEKEYIEPTPKKEIGIEDWAKEFRFAEKENWAIYDENGKIIGRGSGDENSARVTGDVKNRTLIHNHPGQYADMSTGDFNFANKNDPAVMVITGQNGTITIRRPAKGWPTQAEAEAAWYKGQDEGHRVLESYRKKWKSGEWTLEEAEKRGKHHVAGSMYENLGIVEYIDES